jgi:hypothetical protein
MRNYLLLGLVLCLSFSAIGQRASLNGSVSDTIDRKNLQNTLVTVMRASDSVLVKFARADKSGHFSISDLDSGSYILMFTHPYLGDFFDQVTLTAGAKKDLGNINMIPKSKLLEEVIVKSGSPIRIKGDTTIYTADSFKVRPGANVEELLRRLPGISVDKDGKVTAMGERVKKILVDGEEFFGSDPGIVSKSLRADNVKEVQVFDKKSDQAEFTGIDDGVKDKTINLKLKELKGYFGKIELGGGLDQKYNTSAMMNAFKAKRKLAAYGIMSNTGQTNLDWQEAQNYGGGMEGLESGVTDDGGVYISYNGNGEENFYGGRNGIPTNWNGGLHYSNKFHDGKLSLNGAYKFMKVNSPGLTRTFGKVFLPDTSYSTNTVNNNFSQRIRHGLNMTVESNLDSFNSLKWTTRANHNETTSASHYFSESFTPEGDSINNSRRDNDNRSETNGLTSSLLWRHKFQKLSRTLSINADINYNRTTNNGFLLGLNNYYSNNILTRRDTTDQQNLNTTEAQGLAVKAAYTEPLMKDTYLELSYAINYNNNVNDRITNTRAVNGKYETRIDTLSNSFTFKRMVNTPGLNFRINKKKVSFSFGSSVGFSHFIQDNVTQKIKNTYDYVNYFPRVSFQYKIKPNESFRFNYNGSTTAPTPEQLQPIRVNTDPLNIYIGNQDLNQSFRHNFSLGYNFYNVLKERGLWTNINASYTQNAFVQFSTIDSFGKRTYQTVNADGVYNINMYTDYNMKIRDTKWQIGIGPNLNFNQNIDFVRTEKTNTTVKNMTKRTGYGARVSISQYVADKFNFYIGPNFTWNKSTASVNSSANVKYWQLDGWAQGSYTIPGKSKIEISTDMNYQVRQKDPRFPANNSFTTWNANILKRIHKNEYEFKFSVYDILNQNRGYNRDFNSFSFTETYYTTLKRMWMLTFTWNFSKNGKPAGFN